jgi:hypothetical protein
MGFPKTVERLFDNLDIGKLPRKAERLIGGPGIENKHLGKSAEGLQGRRQRF